MKKGEKMSDEQKKKQSDSMKAWWTPWRRKLVKEFKAGGEHTREEYDEYLQTLYGRRRHYIESNKD